LLNVKQIVGRWAFDNLDALQLIEPIEVQGLTDRAEDNWQPLLAIASLSGGDSLAIAKRSALALVAEQLEAEAREDPLPMLLYDIRDAFGGNDKIASEDLVQYLMELEHRPWAEWKGMQPMSKNQLAALLRPLKIQPMTVRLSSTRTPKGYKIEQFEDAFARYLPKTEEAE
jgi:putative DNA primase/helicase